MSFQYSSSSCGSGNRVVGFQGDRHRHGLVRWSESQECSSGNGGRRGGRFSDHLMIKIDGEGDRCREGGPTSEEPAISGGGRPPSPSPICSPSNSCSPASSPTIVDGGRSAPSRLDEESNSRNEGSTVSRYQDDSRGKRPLGELPAIERRDPSPSRSDRLAANIYSSRRSKPGLENSEDERSEDEVRDIHIMEERSRSTANINNHMFQNGRRPRQANWSDTSMGSYISSDAESISLSTEFNNVLAAAAAAGTNSSAQAALETERLRSILEERTPPRRSQLPGIGEEEPARTTNADEADQTELHNNNNRRDEMALVLSTTEGNANTTPGGQQGNRDQRDGRDYLALVPISATQESESNSDRDAPLSSWDTHSNERAMVSHGQSENRGGSQGSASCSGSNLKDVPTPKQVALAKVKKDKIEAKAIAWEEAKNAKVDNRYKREEAIILAWENEQQMQASTKMKKVERKLEEKRAKAYERMQNEIARAHRKAEERRAIAEARKRAEKAKIAEAVDKIRYLGRLPRRFLLF